MSTFRYVPTATEARHSNLLAAALVSGLTPVLGWLEGFTDVPVLLSIGVAMGALTYAAYALIGRATGLATIETGPDALVVERKGQRVEVPWSAIATVRFGTYGGEHLVLTRHDGARRLHIRLDGHDATAIAAIRAAIAARLPAPGRGKPR
jgi:hypothetical protein